MSVDLFSESHTIDGGFVSQACWIQGVYVYEELRHMYKKIAYFGMPKNMDNEGMVEGTQDVCNLRYRPDNDIKYSIS